MSLDKAVACLLECFKLFSKFDRRELFMVNVLVEKCCWTFLLTIHDRLNLLK